jgi:hypothetical protein
MIKYKKQQQRDNELNELSIRKRIAERKERLKKNIADSGLSKEE